MFDYSVNSIVYLVGAVPYLYIVFYSKLREFTDFIQLFHDYILNIEEKRYQDLLLIIRLSDNIMNYDEFV